MEPRPRVEPVGLMVVVRGGFKECWGLVEEGGLQMCDKVATGLAIESLLPEVLVGPARLSLVVAMGVD